MGTYTTNYQLYMPTVGEQGWGTLVNGNFTTIDITMKGLDTRLTAVENEVNGNLSCTSVTTSGKVTANGGVGTTSLTTSSTITSTGLITANGGFKGNLVGLQYLPATMSTSSSGGTLYASCDGYTGYLTNYGEANAITFTVPKYNYKFSFPVKHNIGCYTRQSDVSGSFPPNVTTQTLTITHTGNANGYAIRYKLLTASTYTQLDMPYHGTKTINLTAGATYKVYTPDNGGQSTLTIPAKASYYIKYATP